jgi:gp16 family phage-associated protein
MPTNVSPIVIRAALSRIGKTHGDVARELGVDRSIVRGVLYGHLKGLRGDAHKVAVALGMKNGVIVDDTTPIAEAMKAALAA